jgi:hypothetical protein
LLVGGFSNSKYLQERIRAAVKHDIEVINPPHAWSAVVQGALVKGLAHYDEKHATVRLSSRVARKHIGKQVSYLFEEETDLPGKKYISSLKSYCTVLTMPRYFDPFSGVFKILRMHWFIVKVFSDVRKIKMILLILSMLITGR